jgi:hypothetical protein
MTMPVPMSAFEQLWADQDRRRSLALAIAAFNIFCILSGWVAR